MFVCINHINVIVLVCLQINVVFVSLFTQTESSSKRQHIQIDGLIFIEIVTSLALPKLGPTHRLAFHHQQKYKIKKICKTLKVRRDIDTLVKACICIYLLIIHWSIIALIVKRGQMS